MCWDRICDSILQRISSVAYLTWQLQKSCVRPVRLKDTASGHSTGGCASLHTSFSESSNLADFLVFHEPIALHGRSCWRADKAHFGFYKDSCSVCVAGWQVTHEQHKISKPREPSTQQLFRAFRVSTEWSEGRKPSGVESATFQLHTVHYTAKVWPKLTFPAAFPPAMCGRWAEATANKTAYPEKQILGVFSLPTRFDNLAPI